MPEKKEKEKVFLPLDIESLYGHCRNRIARVGVELEGGWKDMTPGIAFENDTSVFKDAKTGTQKLPAGISYAGEIPVGPFVPAVIGKAITKYYPDKVDSTCGLHVHMSFESLLHYGWLMVPEYQETILEYLIRWAKKEGFPDDHHIWTRLKGQSTYCQKKFWPDEQVKAKKDHDRERFGHRYTVVHYCGRQNTIEVRVLPMMTTPVQSIRAVKEVLRITNACLVKLASKELKESGRVELPVGEVVEEWDEVKLSVK
jgi:hypothetical protein